ncbi:MAG: DUF1805 domain-containing protein [Lentisphaeria bacterium]|nr:DUF1805 domain-containing protein [Lentisphaeria bacterium]
MEFDTVQLDGRAHAAATLPMTHGVLLVIYAPKGVLGCGYLSLAAAEKFSDPLAIVTGVRTYDDMLRAEIKQVSTAAAALGVKPGMTGREALLMMQ